MSDTGKNPSPSGAFEITEDVISHLRDCAARGMNLDAAARAFGCAPTTLRQAAQRQGISEEIRGLFNRQREAGKGQVRHLTPDQLAGCPLIIDKSQPAVRWLTKAWRAAA